MKIRSRIGIGLLVTAIAASAAVPAYAQDPEGGVSRVVKYGVKDVPCDGVAYPVAESWNSYTVALRTPNVLTKNALQKLTYASETWTLDSVSDTYTNESSFRLLGFTAPIIGTELELGITKGTSTTYTHSTTVVPKEINEIDVTPRVDGVVATPTAFKFEGWGEYFKCDVGTTSRVQVGGLNTVKFDVTQATGWVLKRSDGQPISVGDIG